MKLCLFDAYRIGIVIDQHVVDVTDVFQDVAQPAWPYPLSDNADAQIMEGVGSMTVRVAQRGAA